jgi:hypothetical protein
MTTAPIPKAMNITLVGALSCNAEMAETTPTSAQSQVKISLSLIGGPRHIPERSRCRPRPVILEALAREGGYLHHRVGDWRVGNCRNTRDG